VAAEEADDAPDHRSGGVAVVDDVEAVVTVGVLDQLDPPGGLTYHGGRPKVGGAGTPRSARWRWLTSAPRP
jgi:hypothetical protein